MEKLFTEILDLNIRHDEISTQISMLQDRQRQIRIACLAKETEWFKLKWQENESNKTSEGYETTRDNLINIGNELQSQVVEYKQEQNYLKEFLEKIGIGE